jgi:hypothetical protein
MPSKLNPRRSPGTVVAILALVAALGGTAIAAGGLTGTQKKQVRKISNKVSNKVFSKRIGGASVAHANTASTASTANTAKKAETAAKAETADKATDADRLGSRPAGDYQLKLQGSCPAPQAIEAIGQGGEVSCTPPAVKAIVVSPVAGENIAEDLGAGLQLLSVCHDGAVVSVRFQNLGASSANLNWFYGDGSTTSASGVTIIAGNEEAFSFAGARIEGQFIWSVGSTVMTVNLHAFDGTSFCEVRGTAETANG